MQQRIERENQALRAQVGQQNGQNQQANAGDEANAPNHATLKKSEVLEWQARARVAGRRAAALYNPFIELDTLAGHQVQAHIDEILDDVKRSQEGDDELDEGHNPAVYWDTPRFNTPGPVDLAREMIYHLPKSPGKVWLEDWFQAEVSTANSWSIQYLSLSAKRSTKGLANSAVPLCTTYKYTTRRYLVFKTPLSKPVRSVKTFPKFKLSVTSCISMRRMAMGILI